MNKIILCILAALILVPALQTAAVAKDPECVAMNFNVLGMRKLLNNDWKPTNEQDEVGVNFDVTGSKWPVSLDVSYLYATQKGQADDIITSNNVSNAYTDLDRTATTEELGVGVKKIWDNEQTNLSLTAAAGLAWITGRLEFTNVTSFDEAKLGWYTSIAAYYRLLKFLNLGLVGRYSDTKLTLGGRELNAGGWHYGFLVGIGF